jgi:putative addiction module component (TIGR02574 family)
MSDLRSQLVNLSAAEKVELLYAVWESLEADAQSLNETQRAELDSRPERHEKNPSDVIPWEKVREGVLLGGGSCGLIAEKILRAHSIRTGGVQVNILQFLDLCDSNRASSLSLKYGAGGLHVLADERHHLCTLAGVRHVR